MEKKIKTYQVVLGDEEQGISAFSLVSDPAIELPFVKLSKQEKQIEIKLATDKKKRNLMGVLLVPDKVIPRISADGTPYNIVFSRDMIEQLAIRAAQKGSLQNVTVEHGEAKMKGITTYQQWIVESENDKIYTHFTKEQVPMGSLAVCSHVHDESQFEAIDKSDKVGFSIEALLNFSQLELSAEKETKVVEVVIDAENVKADIYAIMVDEVLKSEMPDEMKLKILTPILEPKGDK